MHQQSESGKDRRPVRFTSRKDLRKSKQIPRFSLNTDPVLAEKATKAICTRLGINNIEKSANPEVWFSYVNTRFEACGNLENAFKDQIDYLWLPVAGRFGNNIIQCIHALAFAEIFGIPKIYHQFPWLPGRKSAGSGPVLIQAMPNFKNKQVGLWSGFFNSYCHPRLEALPQSDFVRIIDNYLQPNIRWLSAEPQRAAITVHIRGGDIMTNRKGGYPNYGQPPLAFYTCEIERLANETGRQKIEIISEDRNNPVLDALEFWALKQGMETISYPKSRERRDAKRLVAAEHLIISYSTFPVTLALLSKNTQSLSFFRMSRKSQLLVEKIPSVYRSWDSTYRYTPFGEWKNSVAQRQLIVDFPASAIETVRLDADSKQYEVS